MNSLVISLARRPLPRRLRTFLLYIGPVIFLEKDIIRIVEETKHAAYRQGYAQATKEQP